MKHRRCLSRNRVASPACAVNLTWRIRPTAFAAGLCLFAYVALCQQASSPSVTIGGVFEEVVEDHFNQGSTVTHYGLRMPAGYLELVFSDAPSVQGFRAGQQVRVTGHRSGSRFLVDASDELRGKITVLALRTQPLNATLGIRRVALILVDFTDDSRRLIDKATAAQVLAEVNRFYQEASYGQLSIQGDVFGYFDLPINAGCALFGADVWGAGVQAVVKAGIDLASYQTYAFLAPASAKCGGAAGGGGATIGGDPGFVLVTVTADATATIANSVGVLAHELGHNLGLLHDNALECGAVAYDPHANCTSVEYGNSWDVMGNGDGGPHHFSSVFKDFLGWMKPEDVSETRIYSLAPLESSPRALKISASGEDPPFYLEYRQPIGFDAGFHFTQIYTGALVSLSGSPPHLLNMHPGINVFPPPQEPAFTTPALALGETYVDYARRFSITPISATPTALQLRVLLATPSAPTMMFVKPTENALVKGVVQVQVDALDRDGIAKVELYRDGNLLSAQTGVPYLFLWDTTNESGGGHVLTAKTYSTSGKALTQDLHLTVDAKTLPGTPL